MVGEYEVLQPLGAGGMGDVYEAVHPIIGKRAAIKVLKRTDSLDEARRLLDEARAVNAIRHRGIIDIFGAQVLPDGRPALIMELLEGETLAQLSQRKGPLPLEDVFTLLEGALAPLAAAHRAGIIHRDLKPSNLFLVNDSEGPFVKLLDFGVARRLNRSTHLTNPELTLGSLGFMAPEHLAGEPVPQSDLYSLGCVAWVLITGRPVFVTTQPQAQIPRHLEEIPPSIDTVRTDVTEELAYWVAWLLRKRADERPFTAEVALAALREAAVMSVGEATISVDVDYEKVVTKLDAKARAAAIKKSARADVATVRVKPLTADRRPTERETVIDDATTRPTRKR